MLLRLALPATFVDRTSGVHDITEYVVGTPAGDSTVCGLRRGVREGCPTSCVLDASSHPDDEHGGGQVVPREGAIRLGAATAAARPSARREMSVNRACFDDDTALFTRKITPSIRRAARGCNVLTQRAVRVRIAIPSTRRKAWQVCVGERTEWQTREMRMSIVRTPLWLGARRPRPQDGVRTSPFPSGRRSSTCGCPRRSRPWNVRAQRARRLLPGSRPAAVRAMRHGCRLRSRAGLRGAWRERGATPSPTRGSCSATERPRLTRGASHHITLDASLHDRCSRSAARGAQPTRCESSPGSIPRPMGSLRAVVHALLLEHMAQRMLESPPWEAAKATSVDPGTAVDVSVHLAFSGQGRRAAVAEALGLSSRAGRGRRQTATSTRCGSSM